MHKDDRIFIAGHNGLVGSSLVRKLKSNGFNNLILMNKDQLDLRKQEDVNHFFKL